MVTEQKSLRRINREKGGGGYVGLAQRLICVCVPCVNMPFSGGLINRNPDTGYFSSGHLYRKSAGPKRQESVTFPNVNSIYNRHTE